MLRAFQEADATAFAEIQCAAFGMSAHEDAFRWWDGFGREHLRIEERDGRVAGGLVDIPMGMWVGGRWVSLHGVAGVGVAVDARGGGVATGMMGAYVQQLEREGVALSALYASTRGLYRKVGYEVAGERWTGEIPLDALRGAGARSDGWRPIREADWPAIEAREARAASPFTGRMARGPYLWARVRAYRGSPNRGWWLPGPDGPAAWLVIRVHPGDPWQELEVVDHFADGPASLAALVGLLAGFGTMARSVKIHGHTPIWELLPEHRVDLRLFEPWMVRVCSLRRALEDRGWPPGLTAELGLQVDDPLVRENRGRFTVRVRDGRATVQAGGDGTFALGIGALASLYTGHADPWTLAQRGALVGPAAEFARLHAAFAGPRPALSDFF